MVLAGDRHLLLYSGANWNTADYGVGFAVCDGPAGPCSKPSGGPVYRGATGCRGPVARSPSVTCRAGCG